MDFNILLTALGVVIAIVGSNIALISWIRSDFKSFETEMRSEFKNFREMWAQELKDFHGRLCAIEERNKGCHQLKFL